MRAKKSAIFLALLLILSISLTALNPNTVETYGPPAQPKGFSAPPSEQRGNGYPMNLTESLNCFKSDTLNTTNSFSGNYVKPHNDSFSTQTPTNYGTIWQNITIKNIVAETNFVAVQDGFGASGLKCGSQGLAKGHYQKLAINFTVSERVNLTSVWLRYGAFQDVGAQDPPVIPFNIETDSASHVPSGTVLGSGNLQNTIGAGWHQVQVQTSGSPVTLQSGTVYWLVMDGSSIPGANDGYYMWYYVSDPTSPSYDSKCVAVYSGAWIMENPSFSAINFLSVLVVKAVDASLATKVYSSPTDVQMRLNGTLISGSVVSVDPSKRFFNFTTDRSVSFTANWTARFEHFRLRSVSTYYIARESFTLWNATFTSDSKPSNPYTWYNKTFKVATIPQFWSRNSPPTNITNDLGFSYSFVGASTYYIVNQTSGLGAANWDTGWTIATKSTYSISASLPSQVVEGLPLTVGISTGVYSGSWCNISFFDHLDQIEYTRNATITGSSCSLTLKLNRTDSYTLFLFDRWTGGNEASLNRTLTVNVLSPDCNITVTDRTSPVLGNIGELKFKFYNNSLGMGNTVIEPEAVSVNGTPTIDFVYDEPSGSTTVYVSTASAGWHTGSNTVVVSAESGVFNATKETWIVVQEALCNVTVISSNQPLPDSTASLSFRFFNETVGASPLLIDPTLVRINGTSASFTYSGGVVTVIWNVGTGGWHVGLNHVNVSATRGIFSNYTVATLTIIQPLCNVTVNGVSSPILGNTATAQFRFLNGTNGWVSMPPLSVKINGTNMPFTYFGGVTTVSWNTISGGWRSGFNHVNITAISGVFLNSTVWQFYIIEPVASLTLNSTLFTATYGDGIPVGFSFLNMTGSGTQFPSPPTLYINGTTVSFPPDLVGGLYVYTLSTRYFGQSGSYHLNFTAVYGTFVATNITSVTVNKLVMTISLQLDQTSVTAGSSLSASATLRYPNSTVVEDLTNVIFRFTVTYANGTVRIFNESALTQNGIATSAFTTNGDMTKITVEAIYDGDGIRTSASDDMPDIPVNPPGALSLPVVAGIAGTAVVLALVPIAVRARRKKGKEEEHRKTALLRQTASLAQLVVVDLKSGRCVFSRSLGSEENVDPHLISGFLSANQSILQEVFKSKSRAGLRFADYGDYKVVSHVGDYIMATLFATETAGEELKGVLERFTDKFERAYGKSLVSWDGDTCAFKDADEITDEVFALQLTSPYMLLDVPKAKLSKSERAAVHFARILSAERGVFFMPRVVDYLLTKQGLKRGQAMDAINSLTKRGIIRQLTIEQAAQVVKSTQEKSENQT